MTMLLLPHWPDQLSDLNIDLYSPASSHKNSQFWIGTFQSICPILSWFDSVGGTQKVQRAKGRSGEVLKDGPGRQKLCCGTQSRELWLSPRALICLFSSKEWIPTSLNWVVQLPPKTLLSFLSLCVLVLNFYHVSYLSNLGYQSMHFHSYFYRSGSRSET